MDCSNCHLGIGDVDSWDFADGTPARIDSTEWTTVGHGQPAVGLAGPNVCLYCHDSGVDHQTVANPFRLANTGGADGINGGADR